MLKESVLGKNDSWAIKWYASAVLNDMLTLYPRISLVKNIGNDGSGVHSLITKSFDVKPFESELDLSEINVTENLEIRKQFRDYFISQSNNSIRKRVIRGFDWLYYEFKKLFKTETY